MNEMLEDLQDLESAEDFLEYFEIEFEPTVVKVYRLHILQRFHDYIAKVALPEREAYAGAMLKAYEDFVESDAQTEKVFKVFRMNEPQTVTIPVSQLIQRS